jgi:hypothetical protein
VNKRAASSPNYSLVRQSIPYMCYTITKKFPHNTGCPSAKGLSLYKLILCTLPLTPH